MELDSSAFHPGGQIPAEYTCDGVGISPPLAWTGAPESTVTFALIVVDPDAPGGTFTHWVLYDVPASVHDLPKAVRPEQRPPNGGEQGMNSFGRIGYGAPCPPPGSQPHRYVFTLYAADIALNVPPRPDKDTVLSALQGHIIAQARLAGTYTRQGG